MGRQWMEVERTFALGWREMGALWPGRQVLGLAPLWLERAGAVRAGAEQRRDGRELQPQFWFAEVTSRSSEGCAGSEVHLLVTPIARLQRRRLSFPL